MNTDAAIVKNIRVADEKASYDAACKRLLSENKCQILEEDFHIKTPFLELCIH